MILEGDGGGSDENDENDRDDEEEEDEEKENIGTDDTNANGVAASSSRSRARPATMINFHCIANCSDDYTSVQFGSTLTDAEFQVLRDMIGMLGK